jgi:hypothetical protein
VGALCLRSLLQRLAYLFLAIIPVQREAKHGVYLSKFISPRRKATPMNSLFNPHLFVDEKTLLTKSNTLCMFFEVQPPDEDSTISPLPSGTIISGQSMPVSSCGRSGNRARAFGEGNKGHHRLLRVELVIRKAR